MKIRRIEAIPVEVPLVEPFATNFGRFESRKIVLVKLETSEGMGIGESPVFGPYYSYETVGTAIHVIEEYISKQIIGEDITSGSEYRKLVSPIRGHPFAKSGVELALWDLFAKIAGRPLWRELGGVRERIPSQISIGVKKSPERLLGAIGRGLDRGYRAIKIKILPGWDIDILKMVRRKYPDIPLMVDANAGYSIDDLELLKELDHFDLEMIEQPLNYEDLYNHAKLQKQLDTPICLDESIHSLMDARTAVELDSCKIVNIKVCRVGGLYEVERIQDYCSRNQVDVWCGGMVESGLGKAFNIAAATLPGFTLPNDITPSNTYFVDDLLVTNIELDSDGYINVPTDQGVGYEVNWEAVERFRMT